MGGSYPLPAILVQFEILCIKVKVILKNPAHNCVRNFQGNGLISAKASMTSNHGVPDLVNCLSNLGRVTFNPLNPESAICWHY